MQREFFGKLIIFILFAVGIQYELNKGKPRLIVYQKPEEGKSNGQFVWSYTGDNSPKYWGHLEIGYAACSNGKEQSPINIDIPQIKAVGEIASG